VKVEVIYRNDPERGLTDPLPEPTGRAFVFRLYKGDVLGPFGFGKSWFNPPFYSRVFHFYSHLPLPFVAWRYPSWLPFVGGKAGYIGFKLYGVDNAVYSQWLTTPDEIFEGSQAVVPTIRPFATIK